MKDLSREYSKTPTGDPLRPEIESKLSALYQQRCIANFAVGLNRWTELSVSLQLIPDKNRQAEIAAVTLL